MRRVMVLVTVMFLLANLLMGCDSFWPASDTPTLTQEPTPTATLARTQTPTVTPEPTPTATPDLGLAVPEATVKPAEAFVVAQQEGEGLIAMAALTLVTLTPGRQYRVEVTSTAGAVAYTGSYSNAAVDANGLPVLDAQLLSNNTPTRWDLQPPVAAPSSWTYSISVQTAGGHIRVVIWDVTNGA